MTNSMWTEATYSDIDIRREWKRIVLRFKKPDRQEGFFFAFLYRFLLAVLAVGLSGAIVLLAGWINGWHLSGWLLVFYGGFASVIIVMGEHFRSRAFERIARDEYSHVELEIGGETLDDLVRLKGLSPPTTSHGGRDLGLYSRSARFTKRLFDIVVASLMLWLVWPVFVAVALLIKLTSTGPVLYWRQGYDIKGREIRLLNFRTMRVDIADSGDLTRPDLRVTAVGAFLRKTRLDEMPMFINVFSGELSCVGPPPLTLAASKQVATMEVSRNMPNIRCGLTGVNQLARIGLSSWQPAEWLNNESVYVANWSLWMDIKLLVRTARIGLFGLKAI